MTATATLKKVTAIWASLMLAFALLPVVPAAWAGGDGPNLDPLLKGLNSDGSVDVGDTVYVAMVDLDGAYGDFSSRYSSGDTSVAWGVGMSFAEGDHVDIPGELKDGRFSYTVTSADEGKLLWFGTGSKTDTTYNNNTNQYVINSTNPLLYARGFDVEEVTAASTYSFKLKTIPSIYGSSFNITLQKLNSSTTAWIDAGTKTVGTLTTSATYTSTDFSGLTFDVIYRLKIVSSMSQTAYSDVFILTKKASSSEPGGSGDSGSSTKATLKTKPKITKFSVSRSVLWATVNFEIKPATINVNGYDSTADYYKVKLLKNGKVVKTLKKVNRDDTVTVGCAVRYGKADKLQIKLYTLNGGKVLGSAVSSKKKSVKSAKLKKATGVRATKLASKKALVRWNSVEGATGYRIYKGGKKVKQVKSSKTKATIKGSGAGRAKYRVQAIVKVKAEKNKVYKAKKSKAVKPKKNQVKFNVSTNYKSYKYMTCPFVIKKISLSGKTYTITGYACNNRIWRMKKYSKLIISVFADGKQVVDKTIKNKYIGVKDSSSKKVVIKVKGKAGADLVHGVNVHRYTTTKSYWVNSSGKQVK